MQSDTLLGPFFFECVLGSSSSSSCHTHLGAGQCSFLLEELHSSRSSPSFKLLAVTQFLCARPSSLACKLDLQLPEEQQQHQEVVVPAVTGDGANGGASVNASTTLSVQHSVVAAGLGGQQSKSSRSSSASSAAATSGGGRATVFEEVLLMGQDGACSHSSHRGEPLHSGFCEKPLNSLLHCDVTAFLQKPSTTSSQQQLQQQQTQDLLQCALDVSLRVPWVLQDGKSVNAALLCGLASKVLCVLAERPGAPAAVVHTALCILSAAQTTELLRVLERAGLVEEKRPTVTTHLSDPFEARQVLMRKPPPGAEAVSGYFVLNCC